jgi:hypothetical protein
MSERFSLLVERVGDQAMIAMDYGGVVRARNLPNSTLRRIGDLVRDVRDAVEMPANDEVPFFPGYRSIVTGRIRGMCQATLGAHRLEDGTVERVIGLYDDEDESAPVILLIEEQIDEFIAKAMA